jgi:Pyridine nucleotide-disulphide oxidoreductase
MCRREEIALVGGGNSAGQAAVFLAGFAAKISMLVRADSLASSMSRYLIDRIEARPNIELLCRTEIVALTGTPEGRLERVRWRHAPTGAETDRAIRNVFLFIGADPATNWLRACGVGLATKDLSQRVRKRAWAAARRTGRLARRCRSNRMSLVFSRWATPVQVRSSGSAVPSARGRRLWRICTAIVPRADCNKLRMKLSAPRMWQACGRARRCKFPARLNKFPVRRELIPCFIL